MGLNYDFRKTRPAFSFALLLLDPPIYDDDLFSRGITSTSHAIKLLERAGHKTWDSRAVAVSGIFYASVVKAIGEAQFLLLLLFYEPVPRRTFRSDFR